MGDDVFAGGALSDANLLFGTAQAVKVGDGFLSCGRYSDC